MAVLCSELGMALKPVAHVESVIHIRLAFLHITSVVTLVAFLSSQVLFGYVVVEEDQKVFIAADSWSFVIQLNWFLGSQEQIKTFFCI